MMTSAAFQPLLLTDYRHKTIYAPGVPKAYYGCPHDEIYTNVIAQFPSDPVGFRRLVSRNFMMLHGMIHCCVEHTVVRMAEEGYPSDWSLDTTVFLAGTVPPVQWNENNCPPDILDKSADPDADDSSCLFAPTEEDRIEIDAQAQMNRMQDQLSRL